MAKRKTDDGIIFTRVASYSERLGDADASAVEAVISRHYDIELTDQERMRLMTFEEILPLVKNGSQATRLGWNAEGMWIAYVPAMRGMPPEALEQLFRDSRNTGYHPGADLEQRAWLGLRTVDNQFVPWAPSQTDVLANDWRPVVSGSG